MQFNKTLLHWYSANKRDLPWRKTKDPYKIWLSEIIMQQTQIAQGQPYYEAFIEQYPTIFDLAKADESAVLKLWQGLGYYSRARNLHFTAKYVSQEYNGVFPNTYKALLKLKGVGDYTASAIASFCYNEPSAVVDGNVYRVLSRYFGIDTPINSSQGNKEFKALASSLIDKEHPAEYNQAIMEFGALQCKPKNPLCDSCPLNTSCVALQKNMVDQLPIKINKTKVAVKYFNFLVVLSADEKTIFEKREEKGIWQNLYQFPLIETEKPLKIHQFKNHPLVNAFFGTSDFDFSLYNNKDIIHKLSHQHLHTKFWIITIFKLPKSGISIDTLHDYPTPILLSNFIDEFDFQLL